MKGLVHEKPARRTVRDSIGSRKIRRLPHDNDE
jgi:hypothetical protein